MDLPINLLIVMIVVVIVLVAVLSFLMGVWNPFSKNMGLQQAKDAGCRTFVLQYGCAQSTELAANAIASEITVSYDGTDHNLLELCNTYLTKCTTLCGCK